MAGGRSTIMASALPDWTIAVTLAWSASMSGSIAALPASVHFLLRALRSSTWTVAFWTAIFRPQAFSGSIFFGLPLATTHCAGLEVAHHVDLLLSVGVDREAGDADVELAALNAEDDRVEAARRPLGLDAELRHDRVEQVDVHADDGLAVIVEVLVRLVGRVGADDDLPGGLDLGRQLGGQRRVDRRGRRRAGGRGGLVVGGQRVRATGTQGESGGDEAGQDQ